jgi:hypothetical protein
MIAGDWMYRSYLNIPTQWVPIRKKRSTIFSEKACLVWRRPHRIPSAGFSTWGAASEMCRWAPNFRSVNVRCS